MKYKKSENFLEELYSTIEKQAKGNDKESYTRSLILKGIMDFNNLSGA